MSRNAAWLITCGVSQPLLYQRAEGVTGSLVIESLMMPYAHLLIGAHERQVVLSQFESRISNREMMSRNAVWLITCGVLHPLIYEIVEGVRGLSGHAGMIGTNRCEDLRSVAGTPDAHLFFGDRGRQVMSQFEIRI